MSYSTTHQQKAAETRRANRIKKRRDLLLGLKETSGDSEGLPWHQRWYHTLRKAAAQHPEFLLLSDILTIINTERIIQGEKPLLKKNLINALRYHKCYNKIIHESKNGHLYRAWHRAHAIDICRSLRQHTPHEKTENIWAVLPEKYRDDPNWVTVGEAARILGCTHRRIAGLVQERSKYRIFIHPETKRKLVYLPELADVVNWRGEKFIREHCTPKVTARILSTAEKKIIQTPLSKIHIYYCPELAHL